jgi:hypothetical protein
MENNKKIAYVLHFKGTREILSKGEKIIEVIDGYYAESQPNYEWSFTTDIKKAKKYKTMKGVDDKIFHQQCTDYRDFVATVYQITIEETISEVKELLPR